ncbi:hypothetical protein [Cyanothece sp. BG0011]|uniref:hypothetical protein n=1 Tax=Cyanothece sp. BG0011 TaxID=2082950 RepID=UPI000D1D72A0|nr:hypothetical protein [Cyanothece sp. BG0011]
MTINVSTFELLVKPIAPRSPIPVPFQGVARRVVQGYFLTITNLFREDIRFSFRFRSSAPTPDNLDRRLSQNNVNLLYDIAGDNLPLENIFALPPGLFSANYSLIGSFTLPSRQTATVQLLPNLTDSLLRNPNPDFEIRGFVELSIPFTFRNGRIQPQTNQNVPVLLQPEIRGTFLPNDLSTENIDFDQINYSLVTASGQGENEVAPAGFSGLSLSDDLVMAVMENLESGSFPIDSFSEENQVNQLSSLVANLGQIEPTAENLTQVSELLARMNIPIVMQPRQ